MSDERNVIYWYIQVSKVHEIAEALMEYEEDFLGADVTTQEVLTVVTSVNAVLQVSITVEQPHMTVIL